ncbi:unnamed protein product [Ambrosiozyma monospora]|uniref:Unnamed protein product n=1 Tax=Ambrosiozyma monospora TaxID=43982 RepID=A0A9W7DE41_AMBMO|nr:unnamed protein product [Ambrosiozyma monospora]
MSTVKRTLSARFKSSLSKTKNLISTKSSSSNNKGPSHDSIDQGSNYSFDVDSHTRKHRSSIGNNSCNGSIRKSTSNSSIQQSIRSSGDYPRTVDYKEPQTSGQQLSLSLKNSTNPTEVILLPLNPIDETIPPCTTEELTPILPIAYKDMEMNMPSPLSSPKKLIHVDQQSQQQQPPSAFFQQPFPMNTMSSSTTTATFFSTGAGTTSTAATSLKSPTVEQKNVFDVGLVKTTSNTSAAVFSGSSTRQHSLSFSSISCFNGVTTTRPSASSISVSETESVFTRANQIDHFDKNTDVVENDKLADQMALNILDHISEEHTVDELAKFKEEISSPKYSTPLRFN